MTLTAPAEHDAEHEADGAPFGEWLSAVLADVRQHLASFDPARITGPDAARLAALFTEGTNLFSSGLALAADRAAKAEIHRATGHRSSAEWLAEMSGGTQHQARELLEVGAAVSDQPALDEALRAGKLPLGRAVLVAETVKLDPTAGDELVAAATRESRRGLRDACDRAKARARSKEDEARRAARVHAARSLRFWVDRHDGSMHVEGLLDALAGAQLKASLEARARRIFEEARREGRHELPEAYLADALVESVLRGDAGADGEGAGGRSTTSASVHIRVDLAVLRHAQGALDEAPPDGICEIAGVGPVPLATVEELLGEAVTHLLVTDGVDVTTVCGVGRHVPNSVRQALIERDRTCVVPGCDATNNLEMDHWQVDFAKGGLTTLANLARLCARHHDMKSRGRFTLRGGPGRWEWTAVADPPPDPPPPDPPPRELDPRVQSFLLGLDDDPEGWQLRFRHAS